MNLERERVFRFFAMLQQLRSTTASCRLMPFPLYLAIQRAILPHLQFRISEKICHQKKFDLQEQKRLNLQVQCKFSTAHCSFFSIFGSASLVLMALEDVEGAFFFACLPDRVRL